jgi:putative ABC transport system permease protein
MSLWKIAWRSIQQRSLASFLTGLSMALGVSLVVAVLVMSGVVGKSFQSSAGLGYNMIVGAKGSALQLVFNTVYFIDKPIENIPYSYYEEFLPAAKRDDGKDGKFANYSDLAVPMCMGDYFRSFRVAGTSTAMFDELEYSPGEKYTFAQGRNFKHDEYFTGVMGATAAADTGIKVGDEFRPTHGEGGHEHRPFKLIGILNRTGTPADRAVYVNIEGFYLMEGHAREVEPAANNVAGAAPPAKPADGQPTPLAKNLREVTSILLRTKSPTPGAPAELFAPGLVKTINKENVAQAVLPIGVISRFFDSIIGPLTYLLFVLAVLIVIVSGIGIMVSIYNSMSERRHEIAVMRALGAARDKVMLIVLVESILLALGGGLFGWVLGHLLIGSLSPWIAGATSVSVGFFKFAPQYELILIPALIGLASLVGFLPALSAYRTDVARALTAAP